MYVEFFGIPGVGKTTMRDELTQYHFKYRNQNHKGIKKVKSVWDMKVWYGYKAYRKMRKIWRFIYNEYCIHIGIGGYISFAEKKRFKRSLFVCLYHCYVTKDLDDYYITDHGIIQTFAQLSFLRTYFDAKFWDKLMDMIPQQNCDYIYLNGEPETVMERGKKRALMQNKPYDRYMYQLKEFQEMFDSVSIFIPTEHDLDASKTVEDNVKQLDEIFKVE